MPLRWHWLSDRSKDADQRELGTVSPGIAWNEIQPVRYLLESFSSLSPLAAAIWDDLCFQRA
jgi:hypothetical protein